MTRPGKPRTFACPTCGSETTTTTPMVLQRYVEAVSDHYGIYALDIFRRNSSPTVVRARQLTMYLARLTTGLSWKELGRAFDRHHSTVLYNVALVKERLVEDSDRGRQLAADLKAVTEVLGRAP